MTKCFIIDDEQPAIDIIKKYISKIPNLELIGTDTNPNSGINKIQSNDIDLIFLDIQMDELNGLEVMKELGSKYKYILCTAYTEFAVNSYDLEAVDYLLKPILFERFERAVNRAICSLSANNQTNIPSVTDDYLYVKADHKGKMLKIDFNDIMYIEGRNNYVAFHLENQIILSHLTLKYLEERFSNSDFIRVHKSYIIPMKRVSIIQNNEIRLKNVTNPIPLSPNYKDAFYKKEFRNFFH